MEDSGQDLGFPVLLLAALQPQPSRAPSTNYPALGLFPAGKWISRCLSLFYTTRKDDERASTLLSARKLQTVLASIGLLLPGFFFLKQR